MTPGTRTRRFPPQPSRQKNRTLPAAARRARLWMDAPGFAREETRGGSRCYAIGIPSPPSRRNLTDSVASLFTPAYQPPPRAVLSVELLRLVRLPPARSCLTNAITQRAQPPTWNTCASSLLEPCVGLPLLAKPVVGTGEMSSVFEASERRVTFVPPQTSHGVNPARRRLDLFGLPP